MNPYNCILKKKKEKFFPLRGRKYSTPYCDIVSEINGKTVIANENFKENKMHHGKEEKTSMKLFRNKPFLNCVNDICKQMTHPTIKCTATIQHQTLNSIYKRVNWNNLEKEVH